ncbi:hypothetical protein [Ancylobacter defluvii]|uniref:Uncharacterized protein n=1 Tax=Ancylobacter defluvii TaxID=1282440 RepID=A0A9W6K103_9HYPH|nr:hypothetical protein [Ancylobacter defluvii]MBS7586434.1 hypothetical protein [Ancylobacter defluvii]GLK85715.1 hypothetical protein GCM10017653_37850 [Ancylobacter defluvii]
MKGAARHSKLYVVTSEGIRFGEVLHHPKKGADFYRIRVRIHGVWSVLTAVNPRLVYRSLKAAARARSEVTS